MIKKTSAQRVWDVGLDSGTDARFGSIYESDLKIDEMCNLTKYENKSYDVSSKSRNRKIKFGTYVQVWNLISSSEMN